MGSGFKSRGVYDKPRYLSPGAGFFHAGKVTVEDDADVVDEVVNEVRFVLRLVEKAAMSQHQAAQVCYRESQKCSYS